MRSSSSGLMDVRGYDHADSLLQGRNRESRKVGNNTTLVRCDGDRLAIVLHSTAVLSWLPDGSIRLRTNGWNTPTTTSRISRYLRSPWRVASHRVSGESALWLWHGGFPVFPFVDDATITADDAIVLAGETVMSADDVYAERARLQALRDAAWKRRSARLMAEHDGGPYGTANVYVGWDPETRLSRFEDRPRFHRRGYSGESWDCPRCIAARKGGAA